MQMKVLFVLWESYPPGPASASRCQKLAFGLRETGCESFILAKGPGDKENPGQSWVEDDHCIPYITVPFRTDGKMWDFTRLKRLPYFIAKFSVEFERALESLGITHVIVYGLSILQTHNCLKICKRHGIPVIVDCVERWDFHAFLLPLYLDQELFRILELRKADAIVGISTAWERVARYLGLPYLIVPATCWPEPPSLHPPVQPRKILTTHEFHLMYVGALFDRDLPIEMLTGFKMALERGVNARMTIIGKTSSFKSARRAANMILNDPQLKQRIRIAGFIPESDPLYWHTLARADAYVLLHADSRESLSCFPTRVPPFMLTGKPLITSGVGDLGNMLTDRVDACVLDSRNQAGALSDAIRFLASNPEERKRIGKKGRERAMELFSCIKHGYRLRNFLSGVEPHL